MNTDVNEQQSWPARVWSVIRGENNEGLLLLIILVLLLILQFSAPGSISLRFAADILRSGMVTLALALGLSMVITSGGMDVSFPAIAIFAGYATVVLLQALGLDGRVWPFLVAALMGLILGSLNAVLVARYRMETLIASLATQVIIRGALIAFVGSAYISTLPAKLGSVGTTSLFHMGGAPVNILIVPILLASVALWYVMNHTMFGRSIYAIGGDKESARRIGIRVPQVQVCIYLVAGTLAGMAGLTHVVLSQHASPFELVGTELNVIAAVVIGGTPDTGGRGSVKGTILGVILVSVLQNSLIRMGISSYWHTLVIGAVILLCVAVQARTMAMRTRTGKILEEAEV
ncbi:ABC transporter permease [Propionimicrobium sp. PCR01-08-3]|uniref:ABC transporter permease n=1 Tax=Propionimicrobium sp. PCR01-08-3 TaxID=3052086 RepID=UPI00255CA3EA|nr:ABC transporter permease [Propionimicrobium sp. PCR01-08-3]WIY83961.1 ABC transporter permease [Propionimicrobium sp. PCR01-08-3]